MDKIVDITKILEETALKAEAGVEKADVQKSVQKPKVSNPIFKKLAQFTNEKLSQKFDINDLLR